METYCYENIFQYLANIVTIVGFLGALIGGYLALKEFQKNQLIKRAEFYTSIFAILFKDTTYLRIRERLDQDNLSKDYYDGLNLELNNESNGLLAEMTNYLNFLEYVMVMQKIKVIEHEDIINLLDYYLKSLSKNETAMNFIKSYGFENLESKIKQINSK